jgi:uncharacterized protein (DUF488 family)
MDIVYSIGHSNHEIQHFIGMLRQHNINALADVRSHPYSRFSPQYTKDLLKPALADAGIAYIFLGKELGARSDNPECYKNGKVQYARLAKQTIFKEGINRIQEGSERFRIALMCAEKDPLECHRALLVSKALFESGISINHIHADGTLESHNQFESRLIACCKLPESDMFQSREQFLAEAYAIQGERAAYFDESMANEEKMISP